MSGLSHIAQSERSDIEALENELMARQQDVAELSGDLERLEAELQDERTARLLVDNRVAQLEDAIREHKRLILERTPAKSGRAIDEALWWWVQ